MDKKQEIWMRITIIKISISILATLLLWGCGKTSVTIDERTYEPKIVIIGYLYPERPISNIQITRNFPVGTTIDKNQITLSDANVILTDIASNAGYELTYNPVTFAFEYTEDDLEIDYGKSYRLAGNSIITKKSL